MPLKIGFKKTSAIKDAGAKSEAQEKAKDRKVILIAENDLFLAELLTQRFLKDGYEVVKTDSSGALLGLIKKSDPKVLLLGAPKLDDKDSLEILKKVRASYDKKSLPIVILSHSESDEDAGKSSELGANLFLAEAYTEIPQIIEAVKNIAGAAVKPIEQAKEEGHENISGTMSVDSAESYKTTIKLKAQIEKALVSSTELSLISLVDNLIEYAFYARASDIHIDPSDDKMMARLRIDGVMHDAFVFPKKSQLAIITRIKVLAGMRTDEHQMAQDGRFKAQIKDGSIDIRVSIAPTYYGENCVMRILAEQAQKLSLETLGFSAEDIKKVNRAIGKPYGMILATGPTGSGKTTTLYTILKKLNTKEVSIITIEDPIEYSIKGIDQVQVNEKTGLTFAHGLRFILRQDPNIIMVGEIRDDETANIAINAAMTGHLLLSTLHANDAATALPRLIDMRVEPFLISSTVNIIIGQRLVRQLCVNCRVKKELDDAEIQNLKEFFPENLLKAGAVFYTHKGCDKCGGTGYIGRIGIHEVLEMSDEVRELIMKHANSSEIKIAALKNGMVPMLEDGFKKAEQGITTLEEVLRVFHE
ncbi:MAG: Flp pilus assembly complex ATPase component TadA [Candidatus Liptonbacteria bacterium]|nr:Flp pilus assembly complex ATPase component TadA [Candidatus Liptonbacteria bacterium]